MAQLLIQKGKKNTLLPLGCVFLVCDGTISLFLQNHLLPNQKCQKVQHRCNFLCACVKGFMSANFIHKHAKYQVMNMQSNGEFSKTFALQWWKVDSLQQNTMFGSCKKVCPYMDLIFHLRCIWNMYLSPIQFRALDRLVSSHLVEVIGSKSHSICFRGQSCSSRDFN